LSASAAGRTSTNSSSNSGFQQRGLGHRQRHDGDVQARFQHILDQALGHGLARLRVEAGELAPQRLNQARQQIGRDGGDDADAQGAGQAVAIGAGQIAQLVHGAQDVAGAGGELMAKRGQPDLARAAFDQGRADQAFQLLDLHRQRGLGDRAILGRAAEMAGPGKGLEVAQLFHGQGLHQVSLSYP
jgi:hypothetical protein